MSKQSQTRSTGVGFRQTSGSIKKILNKIHTKEDIGQSFKDNLGRSYIYTSQGLIY